MVRSSSPLLGLTACQVVVAAGLCSWWPRAVSHEESALGLAALAVAPVVTCGLLVGLGWAGRRRLGPAAPPMARTASAAVQAALTVAFVLCTAATVVAVLVVLPVLLATGFVFEGIG